MIGKPEMSLSDKNVQEIRELNHLVLSADVYGELFEEITLAIYSGVLGRGDCAIDCGLNVGDHTRVMARLCGQTGRVYSFEAAPEMMNIAKNRLQIFDNIEYFQKAVAAKSGERLTFNYSAFAHGLSSLKFQDDDYVFEKIEVETLRLDDVPLRPISLIKLDIEGGEFDALRGAAVMLRRDLPVIIFENDFARAANEYGYSKTEFFDFFGSLGYIIYTVAGAPVLPEHWGVEFMPFQYVALHPHSPRTPRAFAVIQSFIYRLKTNN